MLNLWRGHKGLIALLLVGGLVCLLAAVAPQAWATADQNPLRRTIGDCYAPLQGVVFEDVDGDGQYSDPDIGVVGVTVILDGGTVDEQVTVTLDASPAAWPAGFYLFPDCEPGWHTVQIVVPPGYVATGDNPQDVFVPEQWEEEGCGEAFFPLEKPVVGGQALPVNRLVLLTPWVGLAVLVSGIAVAALVWTRRR